MPCIPNFFPKFELSFESERVFRKTRQVKRHFFRYFFVFSKTRENKNCKKGNFHNFFAIFASSEMFEKLGNYRNISEIWKTAISETRENENFGKKTSNV